MERRKYQSVHGGTPKYPGRRSREERRSLSESLADGTSKFFNTVVAKKNGILSDLSSMIENTFAPKTYSVSNSSESEGSATPPISPQTVNIPTPRPKTPKRCPALRDTREREVVKRTASFPSNAPSNRKQEFVPEILSSKCSPPSTQRRTTTEERFSVNGMNVSFDEPICCQRETDPSQPVTNILVSDSMCYGMSNCRARHASEPTFSSSRPVPVPRTNVLEKDNVLFPGSSHTDICSHAGTDQSKESDNHYDGGTNNRGLLCKDSANPVQNVQKKSIHLDEMATQLQGNSDLPKKTHVPEDTGKSFSSAEKMSHPATYPEPIQTVDQEIKQETPTSTTTKRRSNTIDDILFDDYVQPDVDVIIPKEKQPEDLILFEPEMKIQLEINSLSSSRKEKEHVMAVANKDSSDVEICKAAVHRSTSAGSDKSWSSNYSIDSQPDDLTFECMEFMKTFVDKIFHNGEEISQTEKAKFGHLCQCSPGRLWFSRYISSQRVHNKRVAESVFFRLMQYFAVCLFECHEADDFSPAKTLMNMCFTFYCEAPSSTQGLTEKVFLYMYMKEQPIWQSLRFWNAAYFDAVQCERSRRPMSTNSDESETVSDDKQFQENITFGQLGTFACNMREFGLSKELCLEFLRKQSTIANLRKDQVHLLRENIERVKDA